MENLVNWNLLHSVFCAEFSVFVSLGLVGWDMWWFRRACGLWLLCFSASKFNFMWADNRGTLSSYNLNAKFHRKHSKESLNFDLLRETLELSEKGLSHKFFSQFPIKFPTWFNISSKPLSFSLIEFSKHSKISKTCLFENNRENNFSINSHMP